jgi:DNA processing protein
VKALRALSDAERRAWLRLARAPNVGPTTFSTLIDRYESATQALADLPRLMRRGGSEPRALPSDEDAAREIEALAKLGGRLIAIAETDFAASQCLRLHRRLSRFSGIRRCWRARWWRLSGHEMLRRSAENSQQRLLRICRHRVWSWRPAWRAASMQPHEGALGAGTCAVVAGGIDYSYPPENKGALRAVARRPSLFQKCRSDWFRGPATFPGEIASSPRMRAA